MRNLTGMNIYFTRFLITYLRKSQGRDKNFDAKLLKGGTLRLINKKEGRI